MKVFKLNFVRKLEVSIAVHGTMLVNNLLAMT